jgi:hypothetical protein
MGKAGSGNNVDHLTVIKMKITSAGYPTVPFRVRHPMKVNPPGTVIPA